MRAGAGVQRRRDRFFGQVVVGVGVHLNVIPVEEPFELRLVSRHARTTDGRLEQRNLAVERWQKRADDAYHARPDEGDEHELGTLAAVIVDGAHASHAEVHLVVIQLLLHFCQAARSLAAEHDIAAVSVRQQDPTLNSARLALGRERSLLPVRVGRIVSNLLPGLLDVCVTQVDGSLAGCHC